MKLAIALFGSLLAAIAASACCILPVVLGVASVGTLGFSAALTPYRPILMGLTLLLLGAAFYFTYRFPKAVCDPEGRCHPAQRAGSGRFNKAMLWSVTVLTAAALFYPQIGAYRAAATVSATSDASPRMENPSAKTAVFTIGEMTCAECTVSIAGVLKKLPGVREAKVDFNTKRATVRYDGAKVSVAQLRAAIQNSGFPIEDSQI